MLNANIKKVISFLAAFTLIFIVGCSSPEEKRTKSLTEADKLTADGDSMTALKLLEKLSQNYPDDSEILQKIGLIHQDLDNYSEAAFYLGVAHNLSPDDLELLYQAYIAYENAEQTETAHDLLEIFAGVNSAAMTKDLWFRLGELRAKAQKTESALEAYLEGIKLTNNKPSAEVALEIGTLFKQLDNKPLAARWLVIAAKSDDPNALPALFGLLEIHLRSKNWEAAEKTIALLDKKFPEAVDASEWAKARIELKKWRTAQNEMQAKLEQMERERQAEAARQAELAKQAELKKQAELAKQAELDKQAKLAGADQPAGETETAANTSPEKTDKSLAVTDIANAEAIADEPAKEIESVKTSPEPAAEQTESTETDIVFDPSITIQPAEPDVDDDIYTVKPQYKEAFKVSPKESSPAKLTQPEIVEMPPEPAPEPIPEPAPEPEVQPEPEVLFTDTTPLSFDELILQAEKATSRRDYEKAISLYWDALGLDNESADVWNALSKVYLINGQAKNAATTALEATRLDPENIQYVLDYLRVVQRVKKPSDFIKELEIAYDRFPKSPEITLSLARGYQKIGGNNYAASILYRRFIEIAPNHPLRPEAEVALIRMR